SRRVFSSPSSTAAAVCSSIQTRSRSPSSIESILSGIVRAILVLRTIAQTNLMEGRTMQGQILVSGATGTQGGAVARALLDGGHLVRAMTRNPAGPAARALAARGAEVVAADFDDADSLRRAATGVEAVYAMGTPRSEEHTSE